ncbi:hypothetical protein [Halobellus rufus]|nr:hypothetical protein [Halobellus rufus]
MSLDEFRGDLRELVGRYPGLDADDLREVSERIDRLADRREDEQEVL